MKIVNGRFTVDELRSALNKLPGDAIVEAMYCGSLNCDCCSFNSDITLQVSTDKKWVTVNPK